MKRRIIFKKKKHFIDKNNIWRNTRIQMKA